MIDRYASVFPPPAIGMRFVVEPGDGVEKERELKRTPGGIFGSSLDAIGLLAHRVHGKIR